MLKLDGLARADLWLVGGTFKVVPTVFFQLYSIHFDFGSGIHCCRILTTVSADFEKAAMSAGSVSRRDCDWLLFPSRPERHSQSERDWAEDGSTKPTIKFRSYVQCLPAMAFVPPDDVMKAFELLDESQPTTVDQLDELTTFFEHTFVATSDEDVQRLMVQPHSPSKPGFTIVCVLCFCSYLSLILRAFK